MEKILGALNEDTLSCLGYVANAYFNLENWKSAKENYF